MKERTIGKTILNVDVIMVTDTYKDSHKGTNKEDKLLIQSNHLKSIMSA